MKFQSKNQLAAKLKWSLGEVRAFQKTLRDFRRMLNYDNRDLAQALDYSTAYVRMMQGHWNCTRQPSQEFVIRFNAFRSTSPKAKPGFASVAVYDPNEHSIPMSRILAAFKQCPECVWEMHKGYRDERETWWAMRVPQQRYHSKDHRHAAALRRRRKRQKQQRENRKKPGRKK